MFGSITRIVNACSMYDALDSLNRGVGLYQVHHAPGYRQLEGIPDNKFEPQIVFLCCSDHAETNIV